jgi:hypothetical protein
VLQQDQVAVDTGDQMTREDLCVWMKTTMWLIRLCLDIVDVAAVIWTKRKYYHFHKIWNRRKLFLHELTMDLLRPDGVVWTHTGAEEWRSVKDCTYVMDLAHLAFCYISWKLSHCWCWRLTTTSLLHRHPWQVTVHICMHVLIRELKYWVVTVTGIFND